MTLEKEPAGAFNKAQRLIECCLDIDELRVLQGARATQIRSAPFSDQCLSQEILLALPSRLLVRPIDMTTTEWSRHVNRHARRLQSSSASVSGAVKKSPTRFLTSFIKAPAQLADTQDLPRFAA
jgi:hypothetical protein